MLILQEPHLFQIFTSPKARIRLYLLAVNSKMLKTDQSEIATQIYYLRKQGRQAPKMPQPEAIDGPEVRYLSCRQIHKVSSMNHLVPNRPTAHNPAVISVKQHLEHHFRVIRRIPFFRGYSMPDLYGLRDSLNYFSRGFFNNGFFYNLFLKVISRWKYKARPEPQPRPYNIHNNEALGFHFLSPEFRDEIDPKHKEDRCNKKPQNSASRQPRHKVAEERTDGNKDRIGNLGSYVFQVGNSGTGRRQYGRIGNWR